MPACYEGSPVSKKAAVRNPHLYAPMTARLDRYDRLDMLGQRDQRERWRNTTKRERDGTVLQMRHTVVSEKELYH